jgi:hypothetical protein
MNQISTKESLVNYIRILMHKKTTNDHLPYYAKLCEHIDHDNSRDALNEIYLK